jgi:signal transduction histidine kinase
LKKKPELRELGRRKKAAFRKYGLGIRGRLVMCFSCFLLFMLIIIWIFQIFLLDTFYKRAKIKELDDACQAIAGASGDEQRVAYGLAMRYNLCIRVFAVGDSSLGNETLSVENSAACAIHHMPRDVLYRYYVQAVDSGGKYTYEFTPGSQPPGDTAEPGEGEQEAEAKWRRRFLRSSDPSLTQIMCVSELTASDGTVYALFLNTECTPLNATISTMNTQYLWIASGTLLIAVVLALVFASAVSGPLERMTKAARRMAEGDYRPEFRVEGYRETRELADALNYAVGEIDKSDRLQKELIANVSHDLRTPLTMISGYAEVMKDIPGESTPENLQVIIDEAGHLTDLVNDMLDLSRLNAGTREPVMEVFDLTAAVSEVISRFSSLTSYEGYSLSFSHGGSVYVRADRSMIVQVVYNLIGNAVNYSGDERTVLVVQSAGAADSSVRITVTDHGEGIAPEDLPLIWDRYYRVARQHMRASHGSGIGLSIVRGNLELHGADFGVDSTPGQGSSFWFELKTVPGEGNTER